MLNLSKFCRTMLIGCFLQLLPLVASWTPPTLVSVPGEFAPGFNAASLDVNAQNNGVAIWLAPALPGNDSYLTNVQSSFYTFGIGWSPPQIISSLALIPGFPNRIFTVQSDPQISMNNLNYCVGVWGAVEFIPGPEEAYIQGVYAATRNANGFWSPVQRVSALNVIDYTFFPENPSSAVNDSGLAVCAWIEERTDNGQDIFDYIMASFLLEGGSWTTPAQIIGPLEAQGVGENTPNCAIDASGNVVVTYKHPVAGGFNTVFAVTYDALTSAWSLPVTLGPDENRESESLPKAAINVDGNGDAVVVWNWLDIDSDVSRVYASSFTNGVWGPSIIVGEVTDPAALSFANVVMDRFGNSTAIWTQEGISPREVYSSSLPFGEGWTAPVLISTTPGDNFNRPNLVERPISVNENGDVMAVYLNGVSNSSVYSVAKPFGQPWLAPEFITNFLTYPMQFFPDQINVGIGSCGFALSLWRARSDFGFDNPGQIWSSVHSDPLVSPCAFTGSQCREKFAMQSFYVNRLVWGSCNPDCILFYNLYRNGVLIATIPGTGPFAFTDMVGKNSNTYCLTSTNIFGVEGPSACLVLP